MFQSQSEDRPEIFRGHFDECLKHLGRCFAMRFAGRTQEIIQARKQVAAFCGCHERTVACWFRGTGRGSLPIGETAFKLTFYLDMLGYKVIELERMSKLRRNFAELITFDLVSSQSATELLGYSRADKLFRALRSDGKVSDGKEQRMYEEWKKRKEELAQKKEKVYELCALDLSPSRVGPKVGIVRPVAAVSIMQGLLALLEDGQLVNLTPSDANTVLQLSARLSALSSQLFMTDQRKGGD